MSQRPEAASRLDLTKPETANAAPASASGAWEVKRGLGKPFWLTLIVFQIRVAVHLVHSVNHVRDQPIKDSAR